VATDQAGSDAMVVREQALYLDSGWGVAHGERFDVFDPTDERVIASIPAGDEADAEAVLSSARRAQAGWARTPAATRGGYLREMADLIDANRDRLAELVCEEVGKPLEQRAVRWISRRVFCVITRSGIGAWRGRYCPATARAR
jgi:acyl-CoA reductase-like NAD-dependent aldehyde dehydrogenase